MVSKKATYKAKYSCRFGGHLAANASTAVFSPENAARMLETLRTKSTKGKRTKLLCYTEGLKFKSSVIQKQTNINMFLFLYIERYFVFTHFPNTLIVCVNYMSSKFYTVIIFKRKIDLNGVCDLIDAAKASQLPPIEEAMSNDQYVNAQSAPPNPTLDLHNEKDDTMAFDQCDNLKISEDMRREYQREDPVVATPPAVKQKSYSSTSESSAGGARDYYYEDSAPLRSAQRLSRQTTESESSSSSSSTSNELNNKRQNQSFPVVISKEDNLYLYPEVDSDEDAKHKWKSEVSFIAYSPERGNYLSNEGSVYMYVARRKVSRSRHNAPASVASGRNASSKSSPVARKSRYSSEKQVQRKVSSSTSESQEMQAHNPSVPLAHSPKDYANEKTSYGRDYTDKVPYGQMPTPQTAFDNYTSPMTYRKQQSNTSGTRLYTPAGERGGVVVHSDFDNSNSAGWDRRPRGSYDRGYNADVSVDF